MLSASDTLVVMRTSRPYVSYFGPSKQIYGVSLDEYDATVVLGGSVVGAGTLLMASAGNLTLTGAGANAVNTTVADGVLKLAKSGNVASLQDLKAQLSREGYTTATITGATLSAQLNTMINAARTVSKRRTLPRS